MDILTISLYFTVATVWFITLLLSVLFIILFKGGAEIMQYLSAAIRIIILCYFTYEIFDIHNAYGNSILVGAMWLVTYIPTFIEGRYQDKGEGYDPLANYESQRPEVQQNARREEYIQFGSILTFIIFSKPIYDFLSRTEISYNLSDIANLLFGNQIVIYITGLLGIIWLIYNYKSYVLFRNSPYKINK